MWSNYNLLSILLVCTLFIACSSSNTTVDIDENGNERFSSFYDQFYGDSTFQISRIEFPLIRNRRNLDSDSPFWDIDNWQYLQRIDDEDDRIERFLYDLDGVIDENIIISKKFRIKNTYSLINNQWYLTGYSGMIDLGSSR